MRVSMQAMRVVAAAILASALVIIGASNAFAAPPAPTMGLVALQAKIAAQPLDSLGRHSLPGYFKTVVQGSQIVTIEANILGVTTGPLIIFESPDAQAAYGGIVEGMSGSPLYIHDGDALVGAVSYGGEFTIGGSGLATPIDAMSDLESRYSLVSTTLSRPILTTSGLIRRIAVATNVAAASADAQAGTLVVKPLPILFVGGVPSTSKLFASFKKHMEAHNVGVISAGGTNDSSVFADANLSTDLVGGASVAALVSRGDMWLGSVGTVTYASGNNVLAYGHPADWDGATSMYMTNAVVDGIFRSTDIPYKMARPTAVRGEITQDRGVGIMGRLGQLPQETTITANVTDVDTHESTSTHVFVPSKLLDTVDYYSDVVPMGVYPAASQLLDTMSIGGSALTTTTVVVSDGTHTYSVVQPNVIDDPSDIADAITYDSWDDVMSLQTVQSYGLENLHIVSITLDARVTLHHNNAEIAAVDVPGGIKTGVNHAIVSLLAYGQAATQTVDATFTVPPGVNTRGLLTASSSQDSMSFYNYLDSYSYSMPMRESISDIVGDLNSMQPNNVIGLSFQPYSTQTNGPIISPTPIATMPRAIETSAVTTWALSGAAEAGTPVIYLRCSPSTVDYDGSTFLNGYIDGPDVVGLVSVYAQQAGTVGEKFLGYATVMYASEAPGPLFSFFADGLKANTTLRVHIDASPDGQWTSANATAKVNVRAHLGLTSSAMRFSAGKKITLKSRMLPSGVGGTITFQRWNSGRKHWYSINSAKLVTSGGVTTAVITWRPGHGTHKIRAHYAGGSTNIASNSRQLTLTVN